MRHTRIIYVIVEKGTGYQLGRSGKYSDIDKYGDGLTPIGFFFNGEYYEEFERATLKEARDLAKELNIKNYKITKITWVKTEIDFKGD